MARSLPEEESRPLLAASLSCGPGEERRRRLLSVGQARFQQRGAGRRGGGPGARLLASTSGLTAKNALPNTPLSGRQSAAWAKMSRRAWARARRAALDRDGRRCTACGRAGRLEVHHLRSLDHGGKPFDLDNLRTLCREHHIRIHDGEPHPEPNREFLALVQELLS